LTLNGELQLSLFEHKAKTVRLTDAGRIFLAEAQAVLQRVRSRSNRQSGEQRRKANSMSAYAPSLTTKLLPQALKSFQEANPACASSCTTFHRGKC
jgi:DNA-binding transcriptional LysR family regulator